MSRRLTALLTLLLLLPLASACGDGPPWGGDEEAESDVDRDVFGPTAAYDRRLIFLGPGEALPTGVVFDFAALSDSTTVQRGIRGRLIDGADWVTLMDEGWEMEPMREPWRLVPHGPLRVIVGDGGELDALVFEGEEMVRLEAGAAIGEYSPDAGTQLVLRQGRLRLGDEPIPGILLDAQLARAITPARPTDQAPTDSVPADSLAADTAAEVATAEADQDTAGVSPDPLPGARPGTEALLLDNSGYYAVFGASAEGEMAWLRTGDRDDVRAGARLEPTAWEDFRGGVQVPTAWRITSPDAALTGELSAESSDRTMLEGGGTPGAMGYVVVTGYVEDRGVRRNVYGLVRHVR